MKKVIKKSLAILLITVIMSGLIIINAAAVNVPVVIAATDTVAAIQTRINNALASTNVTEVTVTGSNSNASTTLKLDIPSGVTVVWDATYRGTANPVIDISGNGVFETASKAWIQNTSSGNSFTTIRANNPAVAINGGTVQAGKGRAIEGAGAKTTVLVAATGVVFNASTNNLFPCIDMTHADNTGLNVVINANGEVFSDPDPTGAATVYGYAIQTYGNVLIMGGKVYTTGRNGRCINLVGMNSTATVSSGTVTATGANGVAISTSTTNPGQVTNSSVIIEGGFVASFAIENGWAIRTTGANSTVNITGGCVFAFGNSTQYSGTSLTSVPAAATNSVIFIQGREGGYTGPGSGVVMAWDRNSWNGNPHNRAPYQENAVRHILTSPSSLPGTWYARWEKNLSSPGINDGIRYYFGTSSAGFIPLTDVVVRAKRTIRPVADSGGGAVPISPSTTQEVDFDDTPTFTFDPGSNVVQSIDIINAATNAKTTIPTNATSYTFPPVRHDYIIVVHFQIINSRERTVVSYAGEGGVIYDKNTGAVAPQLVRVLANATGITREVVANPGFHIYEVFVDGVSIPLAGGAERFTYEFPALSRNSVISATFMPDIDTHLIEASAGTGGSILPQGEVSVIDNGNRSFTITPNPGFYIDEVWIDDVLQIGARSVYEFTNVTEDHTISVTFAESRYTNHIITTTAGNGGRITPSGINPDDPDQAPVINASKDIEVPEGATQRFTITPDPGFRIRDVIVNGTSQGAIDSYTFDEVRSDHTIRVEFEPAPPPPPQPTGDRPPQTGDHSPLLPFFIIALGTLSIMGLVLYRRRLKKGEK